MKKLGSPRRTSLPNMVEQRTFGTLNRLRAIKGAKNTMVQVLYSPLSIPFLPPVAALVLHPTPLNPL